MYQFGTAVLAGLTAIAASVAGPSTPAEDQQRADDAIAVFSARLDRAGFRSTGAPDEEFVSACLGGLDNPSRLAELAGETARSVSDSWIFVPPDAEVASATEIMSAAVFTVDALNVNPLDDLVALVGSSEAVDCKRAEYLTPPAGPDATFPPDMALPVLQFGTATALGPGDESARFDMHVAFEAGGERYTFSYSTLVAVTGRSLVVVWLGFAGDGPYAGVDPQLELAALVVSLTS
ncbi:MAG: hypothetical protein ACRD0G_14075 [Acidimicrobiales bacterium]